MDRIDNSPLIGDIIFNKNFIGKGICRTEPNGLFLQVSSKGYYLPNEYLKKATLTISTDKCPVYRITTNVEVTLSD